MTWIVNTQMLLVLDGIKITVSCWLVAIINLSIIVCVCFQFAKKGTKLSPYLQYASVQIIHNSVCEYFFNSKMRDTNICVGTKQKKSPCIGDSGGGLTIYEEHKGPIVYGIVSFGDEIGCQLGYPAVFTRVSSYIQWIDKNTDYQIEYRRGNQRTKF